MAYGYWKMGIGDRESVFHLFFRKKPFQGNFAIAAGLETAISFIRDFHFDPSDLAYLETLTGADEKPLFDLSFLDYLSKFRFTCDVDAMLEGTPAFPYEPLLRVQGPLIQAQLLESPLLNLINFPTLIATKAARITWAARPDPVVEFGVRRAQGIDGALTAARSAYIGGCHATSNVLAGKLFGIPVKGTHAHSWIMAFEDEEKAFEAYAETMPDNCLFLVDTYDSIVGVKKAIAVAKRSNVKMLGVRLDSGDLAHLSIEIRKLLNKAGFPDCKIMASNELDEQLITDLKHQGAKINLWGVGTNLVTGKDQPALDGVYKLSAIRAEDGTWENKIKISEQRVKVTTPGILQVRRYSDGRGNVADMIYDLRTPQEPEALIIDPLDPSSRKLVTHKMLYQDLLVPILRKGEQVMALPSLAENRERTGRLLDEFAPTIRRFLYPQFYFVGLEKHLYETKINLINAVAGTDV